MVKWCFEDILIVAQVLLYGQEVLQGENDYDTHFILASKRCFEDILIVAQFPLLGKKVF